ncbi:MAG TPA: hypothetical protein VNO70_11230 [Blastocatellia bacterium]|nr:hypothetical protein [Blastocatellia bacterium]
MRTIASRTLRIGCVITAGNWLNIGSRPRAKALYIEAGTWLKRHFLSVGLLIALMAVCNTTAAAQSTLFNIPSTDAVPKGKTYLEFDFISHLESHSNGGFQTYVPRAVFGLGKGVEIGANLSFTDALAPDQPVELQPNLKWQFYSNEDNGLAASAGIIGYLPIANRNGVDDFALVYSNVSKKFKGQYGPRLTGGAYGLVGREDGLGTKGGAIVGYEQPLHAKVSFVADWLSGYNRFGYVTPGLAFTLPKNSLLYAGYSIGNEGRKNNALFLYYGITF